MNGSLKTKDYKSILKIMIILIFHSEPDLATDESVG